MKPIRHSYLPSLCLAMPHNRDSTILLLVPQPGVDSSTHSGNYKATTVVERGRKYSTKQKYSQTFNLDNLFSWSHLTYPKSQPSHSNSLSSLSLLPQASQNIGSSSTSGSSCSLSSTVIYREVELSIEINISHYTCKIICTFDVFKLLTFLNIASLPACLAKIK